MAVFNPNQGEQQGELQPPPAVPVRQFTTPDASDGFYSERVDVTSPEYRPIQRGTLYSSIHGADQQVIDLFPTLRFVQETLNPFYHPWAIRTWASDRLSEDTYNPAVEYVSEAVNFPAYTRIYMVRRDVYDRSPTKEIGTPLDSLIGVKILDPGGSYKNARFDIDPENGAEIQPVFENGSDDKGSGIIAGIITKQGSGFSVPPKLSIIGDGSGCRAHAIIQPQGAILVSQKKHELPDNHPLGNEYVLVTQVYETLPGPWVISQKIDNDGPILTIKTRRNISADIVVGETLVDNLWTQTTKVGKDDFVAEESQESRTIVTSDEESATAPTLITERVDEDGMTVTVRRQMASQAYIDTIAPREYIEGGLWVRVSSEAIDDLRGWLIFESRPVPGNVIKDTKVDEDGFEIDITRQLKQASLITTDEVIVSGIWRKRYAKAVSDLVAWEVIEARAIPGNPIESTKVDEDGVEISVTKTLKALSTITTTEVITGGVWIRTHAEAVSDLVGWEVVEARTIPGNPIDATTIDSKGNPLETVRTLKATSTIVTSEDVVSGIWIKRYGKEVTELVSWEIVEGMVLPGVTVPSAQVNGEAEVVNIHKRYRPEGDVTASSSESGGFITEVVKNEVTDSVSEEETRVYKWVDKASYSIEIPNLIPAWARPQIPTIVESHILAGTASQPVLGPREFEARESQQTKLLYERRVTKIPDDVTFPVTATNHQTGEQYGGALLTEQVTLDESAMTADEGFLIVSSEATTLAVYNTPPPDGLFMKRTLFNPGTEWPTLLKQLWDDEMQIMYDREEQVVERPYTVTVPTAGDNFVETAEEIDEWRANRIKITKNPDAVDLASALEDIQAHPYQFPGWLALAGGGYYRRSTRAELTEHTIRTWWIASATKPTTGATGTGADVEYDPIIMDNIIISTLNNTSTLAYSGEILHDDLTTFGVLFWPETTPNMTDYTTTWIGTERVISANVTHTPIPFLWKAQTVSAVMR